MLPAVRWVDGLSSMLKVMCLFVLEDVSFISFLGGEVASHLCWFGLTAHQHKLGHVEPVVTYKEHARSGYG